MQSIALLALAATAIASPLVARTGGDQWGSCESSCQYSCTTVGLVNVANCVSALNGNTISLSLGNGLTPKSLEERCDWGCSSSGSPTCCTTDGLLNVLNCVDLLNGNTISVSLLDVSGM